MLSRPERQTYGMTGIDMIMRLRAIGVDSNKSTIYKVLSRLRKNGLITKGREEVEHVKTQIFYYITKVGQKYLKSTEELLQAVVNIK